MIGVSRSMIVAVLAIAMTTSGAVSARAAGPASEPEPSTASAAAAEPAPTDESAPAAEPAPTDESAPATQDPEAPSEPVPPTTAESQEPPTSAVTPDLLEAEPEPETVEPPQPSKPAPESDSPVSPKPAGLVVTVEGGSPGQLELFRIDPNARGGDVVGTYNGLEYVRVCAAPCDRPVAGRSGDAYFVAGRDVMPSRPFTLDEYDDAALLRVRPGPKKLRYAGFGLTVGGAILVPGGTLLVAGFDAGKGVDAAGYALIGVGLASLTAGIVLLVRGRTLVEIEGRQRGPGRGSSLATVRF